MTVYRSCAFSGTHRQIIRTVAPTTMSSRDCPKTRLNLFCQQNKIGMPIYGDSLKQLPGGQTTWVARLVVNENDMFASNRKKIFKTKLDAHNDVAAAALKALAKEFAPPVPESPRVNFGSFVAKVYQLNAASVKARVAGDGGVVTLSGECAVGVEIGDVVQVTIKRKI